MVSTPTSGTGPREKIRRARSTRSTTRTTSASTGCNVTTLPMLYAAYPLYRIGGTAPCSCSRCWVRCSARFAARALARRLGGGTGWTAFWAIGLASPVAIYALDFWEHSIGLALMLWGVVLRARRDRRAGRMAGRRRRGRAVRGGGDDAPRSARLPRRCRNRLGRHARRASTRVSVVPSPVAAHCSPVRPPCSWPTTSWSAHRSERRCEQAGPRAPRLLSARRSGTRIREAFTTTIGLNRFEPDLDFVAGRPHGRAHRVRVVAALASRS